jgi:tetratricopeptide (TPR) repeat protein
MIPWFSRFPSIFLAAVLAVPSLGLAQSATPPAAEDAVKKQVTELLGEAYNLQTRKRFVDALTKLGEAEALDPENPEVYNLRGSIYLGAQIRNVELARADFNKAKELSPDQIPPFFNLAETEFVAGNFAAAETSFTGLVEKFPRMPLSMRHLVHFKILVSMAKQQKLTEGEAYLAKHFGFLDDTPAYYFAKGVLAIENKRATEGNEWMAKAQIIFKKPDNAPYLDSLMESHYIHSIDIPAPSTAPAKR